MANRPRDTARYRLYRGRTIIRSGITNDADGRKREHQREYGENVRLEKVGPKVTREWEREATNGHLTGPCSLG